MSNRGKTREKVLKKDIRLYQLFSLGFGTIIGVGWLIVAGSWVLTAGPLGAIIAFVVGGLAISLVAMCYTEMGSRFPHSGGEVVYVYEAFGPAASFVVGWALILFYVSICAFEAISTAWIISILLPGFEGPVLYTFLGVEITLASVVIGVGGMAFLTWLNYRGGGSSANFQDIATLLFALASVLFILGGIAGGKAENLEPIFGHEDQDAAIVGFITVLATIPVWYSGFNTLPQALGEVTDVSKPKLLLLVMMMTILAACLFYIGVILAIGFAADRHVVQESELPVAAALFSAFENPWFGRLVLIAGLLGIITSWNAMFFSGARALFAMSRAYLMPKQLSAVHAQRKSPYLAVLFIGMFGTIGVFFGREAILPIINLIGFLLSISYIFVCASVLKLRRVDGPGFRVPANPILPSIALFLASTFLVLAIISIISGRPYFIPFEFVTIAIWSLMGIVVWGVTKADRNEVPPEERRRLIHLR